MFVKCARETWQGVATQVDASSEPSFLLPQICTHVLLVLIFLFFPLLL